VPLNLGVGVTTVDSDHAECNVVINNSNIIIFGARTPSAGGFVIGRVWWFIGWLVSLFVVISRKINGGFSFLTFERSRSKFKVKTAVLKMFHL